MGKHSAGRRRTPLAVATGAAAVLATGAFATTLADGSLEVPRVAAAPGTTPTSTEPVTTRTPDRGDDLNRASRSFTRTSPPSTAPAADAGSPSSTPSDSASASASATPSAARSLRPSASPSASPTPSSGATPSATPTAPATPSATPSPTPTGSVLDVAPGIIGGLLP